jgi:CRISPR-associated protein Cas5
MEHKMDIDLSFLFEEPKLDMSALLNIQPLAPLSMVNSMPGSYYKTEHAPTKFMLCGLMENVLGLHVSDSDRQKVRRDVKRHLKKMWKVEFPDEQSPVGYMPLVHHLFAVGPVAQPEPILYEDLWTQHLIGGDERHLKGVTNYDWRLEAEIGRMNQIEDGGAKTKARNEFFKSHRPQFPQYYRSPQRREFLITERPYEIRLTMTKGLFHRLTEAIQVNNLGYLGTSEGWVDVELEEFS